MTAYATLTDLRTFMGLGPDDVLPNSTTDLQATRYLRTASGLVRTTTRAAVYATDQAGLPTDAALLTAMAEAAMTHAEAWVVSGIDPVAGRAGIKRRVKSKSASGGGLSVTYEDDDPRLVVLADGLELIPEAWHILDAAGLITTRVQSATAGQRDTYLVGTEYRITTGRLLP